MATVKCITGTDAAIAVLDVSVQLAQGYPIPGVQSGKGPHAPMPATWDGIGPTPFGWTQRGTLTWLRDAGAAAIPIDDATATDLQQPASLERIPPGDRGALISALNSRADVDLESGMYSPKTRPAAAAAVAIEAAVGDEEFKP